MHYTKLPNVIPLAGLTTEAQRTQRIWRQTQSGMFSEAITVQYRNKSSLPYSYQDPSGGLYGDNKHVFRRRHVQEIKSNYGNATTEDTPPPSERVIPWELGMNKGASEHRN
jgi:hypothetical protein